MACIINDDNPIDSILGCTDPLAINYFSGATVDDGSCFYEGDTIIGCTDPLALNYNPFANLDDGHVCEYEDCPNEVTIRPTDGAVFYSSTSLPNDDDGGVVISDDQIEFTGQNVAKGQAPLPQSLPLSEFCCTESVVGEPVTWNPELELCIVNKTTNCPEPLAVTLQGVIIGPDGNPVNESCCNDIDVGEWDPNFVINGEARLARPSGACGAEGDDGFNVSQCTSNLTFTDTETQNTLITAITFNNTLDVNQEDCCLYYSQTVDGDYFWDDTNNRCIKETSLTCTFGETLGGSFNLQNTFGQDITGLPVIIENADCVCGGLPCNQSIPPTETKDFILNLISGTATINIDMYGGDIVTPNCNNASIFAGTGFGVQLLNQNGTIGLGDRTYSVGIASNQQDCWRITEPGTYTIRMSVLPYFADNNDHRITVTVT
jgi:hypothetical protein